MAQPPHKSSNTRSLRSALRHKRAADTLLADLAELGTNITGAAAKVAADTNTTWDTDYVATWASAETDWDLEGTESQHKASLRKVMISSLSHKRLANEMVDAMEEAQVSLNVVLAQMDADSGTLSIDSVYEAFRITDVIDPDAEGTEAQHKASFRKSLQKALAHSTLADSLIDDLVAAQTAVNSLIDDIQAAN